MVKQYSNSVFAGHIHWAIKKQYLPSSFSYQVQGALSIFQDVIVAKLKCQSVKTRQNVHSWNE